MAPNRDVLRPIVLGAKTRLAHALIAQLLGDSQNWSKPSLVARSHAELEHFRAQFPDCESALWESILRPTANREGERVVIFCCALGPIHPTPSTQPTADLLHVQTELEWMRRLLDNLRSSPVHLVFVSTALAVSSGTRRYYYSGWKRLLDASIHEIAREFPDTHVSVVYPGRLVEAQTGPSSWLSTTYRRTAQILLRIARGPATRAMIGMDSRLLLMQRALTETWMAITGSVR